LLLERLRAAFDDTSLRRLLAAGARLEQQMERRPEQWSAEAEVEFRAEMEGARARLRSLRANAPQPAAARPEPPSAFMCPISHELMSDPVVASDGHCYQRNDIESWLEMKGTSPMTGAPLAHPQLYPNFSLRSQIENWKDLINAA